jgi:DUF2075 family protein/predicted GIY-YIG superfamily endonuclease
MATIKDLHFEDSEIVSLKEDKYTRDWPVVYLLENGNEAYIGETMSAHSRFKQHMQNSERRKLSTAHVFIDDEYNKSASLDIESWLIQYLAADGKFMLQNGNKGMADHDYFDRDRYRAKFEVLWEELQAKDLARSDLVQLRNSDVFKYSPYKALTIEQLGIVKEIEADIFKDEYKTYVINGDPGTGKSVLAVYLTKFLTELSEKPNLKIALVVPMVGLRHTLQKVFRNVKGLDASMVIAPNHVMGNQYDLLIVDEAHRLRQRKNLSGYLPFDNANRYYGLGNEGTQLDWIMMSSKSQVLLFDENQSVMPGDISTDRIKGLRAKVFTLSSQLRVQGGDDYIQYIDDILTTRVNKPVRFDNYDLRYFESVGSLINEIKAKNKEFGLSRVVAGYAWDWKTKTGKQDYDIDIDGLKLVWNSTNTDWVNSTNSINEIGCIHTVQGYDLNYVGVIIGPELSFDSVKRKLIVDKDKYKDINGKRSIETLKELEKYVLNVYKTLLTRGIKGTYIYAVDDNLAAYIKSSISSKIF